MLKLKNIGQKIRLQLEKPIVLFSVILLVQFFCYNYDQYVQLQPRSIHAWRQTDCLSFSLSYYNNRASIIEPCVNNLGMTNDGKVASDFPIVQFIVGKLWKITGVSQALSRLVNLSFLIFGLWHVFKLFRFWVKDYWLSAVLLGVVFTSPILAYYGITSISDIQAFGLSCAGMYYLVVWQASFFDNAVENKKWTLQKGILLFTLAGLLKLSAAFVFVAIVGFALIEIIFSSHPANRKLMFSLKHSLWFLVPLGAWAAWYTYAGMYNKMHPNSFFLIGIMPFWEVDSERYRFLLTALFNYIFPQVFNPVIFYIILAGLCTLIIRFGRLYKVVIGKMIICILGILSFVALFYQVFDVHDYYMINMVPLIILLIGLIFKIISQNTDTKLRNTLTLVLFLFGILFTHNAAVKTRARIDYKDGWGMQSMVFNDQEHNFYRWNTWDDRSKFGVLENLNPEAIGIMQSDTILCLGDMTINRSLFLLNRVGYTSFNCQAVTADEYIESKKQSGLHYLILIDPSFKEDPQISPYLENKIFEKENTSIYKL